MEQRLHHPIEMPEDILKLKDAFVAESHKLYVVGGAVRDSLLGKSPKDFDLATDAVPDEVESIAQGAGYETIQTGKAFGIVIVVTPSGKFEIATFRKDVGKGRRPDAVEFTTIENDVQRRDLTINALFYDIDTEEVVDLVGGIEDIRNHVIRTVGDPKERFDEDRLRILRAVRFAGRFGNDLDPETDRALKEDASLTDPHKGEKVSEDRIRDEFLKGIKSAKSVRSYLEMLDRYKLFDEILPGLRVDNSQFAKAPRDPVVAVACLIGQNNQKLVEQRLKALHFTACKIDDGGPTIHLFDGVMFLVRLLGLSVDTAVALKRLQPASKLSAEQINEFGKLQGIDSRMLAAFLRFDLSVDGKELMQRTGMKPGKEVGETIQRLETENFKGLLDGTYAAVLLEAAARRIAAAALPEPIRSLVGLVQKNLNNSGI